MIYKLYCKSPVSRRETQHFLSADIARSPGICMKSWNFNMIFVMIMISIIIIIIIIIIITLAWS